MRRLLIGLALLIGSVLTGLLLASLLLQQMCPDCDGRTRYFAENPKACVDGPAVLDCPRCGDRGRVSLFNGYVDRPPEPLMAAILHRSNRGFWLVSDPTRKDLNDRIAQAGMKSVVGWGEETSDVAGSARFVRDGGKSYILAIVRTGGGGGSEESPARILLFDLQGTLLDAVRVAAFGSPSLPAPSFVIPVAPGGPCVRVRLLVWKNGLPDAVEVHHAGRVWKGTPADTEEKLGLMEWTLTLRDGRFQVRDARGKSVVD